MSFLSPISAGAHGTVIKCFTQNLEKEIKEIKQKLDRLVNAFLNGTIEKEIYLAKKMSLLKNKTALLQKKADFGRKGNNWIEPLKEWILSAHHVEKLASLNDFDKIKSFVKKMERTAVCWKEL